MDIVVEIKEELKKGLIFNLKSRPAIGQILANQQNCSNSSGGTASSGSGSSKNGKKPSDLDTFPGFKSAIEACMLDWKEYPIPGVTYGHNSHYLCPFAVFKLNDSEPTVVSHVNSSAAVLRCEYPGRPRSTVQQLQVQLDHKSAEVIYRFHRNHLF